MGKKERESREKEETKQIKNNYFPHSLFHLW